MTLTLIPDCEQAIGDYLRELPEIQALGARVAGEVPSEHSHAWVKVTQLDGRDASNREHLIDYLVQLDCYAGDRAMRSHAGQAEAWIVARTVRAALAALRGRVIDLFASDDGRATVSGVVFTSMIRLPDKGYEPARERVVLDTRVFMHRV